MAERFKAMHLKCNVLYKAPRVRIPPTFLTQFFCNEIFLTICIIFLLLSSAANGVGLVKNFPIILKEVVKQAFLFFLRCLLFLYSNPKPRKEESALLIPLAGSLKITPRLVFLFCTTCIFNIFLRVLLLFRRCTVFLSFAKKLKKKIRSPR